MSTPNVPTPADVASLIANVTTQFAALQASMAQMTSRLERLEAPPQPSAAPAVPVAPAAPAVPPASSLRFPKPPFFSGRAKELLPWAHHVSTYLKANNCPSQQYAVMYAASLLKGDAKMWFLALQARANDGDAVRSWEPRLLKLALATSSRGDLYTTRITAAATGLGLARTLGKDGVPLSTHE